MTSDWSVYHICQRNRFGLEGRCSRVHYFSAITYCRHNVGGWSCEDNNNKNISYVSLYLTKTHFSISSFDFEVKYSLLSLLLTITQQHNRDHHTGFSTLWSIPFISFISDSDSNTPDRYLQCWHHFTIRRYAWSVDLRLTASMMLMKKVEIINKTVPWEKLEPGPVVTLNLVVATLCVVTFFWGWKRMMWILGAKRQPSTTEPLRLTEMHMVVVCTCETWIMKHQFYTHTKRMCWHFFLI